jgi:hypothetical protein
MSKRYWSVFAMAAVLAFAGSAYAHDDDHDRDRANRGYYDGSRIAQDNGYRDGAEHGRYDRSRNIGYNYKSDAWKHGDRGYQKSHGSKGQYKQAYRGGYQSGYNDAFNGRGGWGGIFGRDQRTPRDNDDWGRDRRDRRDGGWGNGGYGGYSSEGARIAYQNGLAEGRYYAQEDQARGRRENPSDQKGYKDADRGYNSRYDRDEYKRVFRDAFVRGYNEGFNTYGRRW